MSEKNLADAIKAAQDLLDQAIAEAGEKVEAGQDNPAIKRNEGGKSFVISSSAMFGSDNWSAFFHDWKAQYRFVKELLEAKRFTDLQKMLDGKTVDQRKLAPQVIEHVKTITGKLAG